MLQESFSFQMDPQASSSNSGTLPFFLIPLAIAAWKLITRSASLYKCRAWHWWINRQIGPSSSMQNTEIVLVMVALVMVDGTAEYAIIPPHLHVGREGKWLLNLRHLVTATSNLTQHPQEFQSWRHTRSTSMGGRSSNISFASDPSNSSNVLWHEGGYGLLYADITNMRGLTPYKWKKSQHKHNNAVQTCHGRQDMYLARISMPESRE